MKTYTFKCTGMSYHQDAFKAIEVKNPDYSLSYSELKDTYEPYERIYQKEYPVNMLSFEFENNEYDENAVKVMADGHHVAYIKKGSCSQVKNLLKSPLLKNVTVEIAGGKYKIIKEQENDDGDTTLKVYSDEAPLWVHLTFYVEEKKKFCTQCGKQIDPSAKYCIYCGSKL